MARTSSHDTRKHLGAVKITTGLSWRKLAVAWGYPPSFGATLSRVYRGGHVSLQTENAIRKHLNRDPLPAQALAPVCPTCGIVHAIGDCGGVDGELAIVPPGHVVRPVPKKRKRMQPRYRRISVPIEIWSPELEARIQELIEEAQNEL